MKFTLFAWFIKLCLWGSELPVCTASKCVQKLHCYEFARFGHTDEKWAVQHFVPCANDDCCCCCRKKWRSLGLFLLAPVFTERASSGKDPEEDKMENCLNFLLNPFRFYNSLKPSHKCINVLHRSSRVTLQILDVWELKNTHTEITDDIINGNFPRLNKTSSSCRHRPKERNHDEWSEVRRLYLVTGRPVCSGRRCGWAARIQRRRCTLESAGSCWGRRPRWWPAVWGRGVFPHPDAVLVLGHQCPSGARGGSRPSPLWLVKTRERSPAPL